MQANSSVPESSSGVGNNGNGTGNDSCLADSITNSSNVALSGPGVSGNNLAQGQPHQQHLRSSVSPGQQHQLHIAQLHQQQHQHHHQQPQSISQSQHMSSSSLTPNHHHMSSNVHQYAPHSGAGGYHQRQAQHQHYHSQHQQMQQYHQHQSSKYGNQQRGDGNETDINHVLLITVINPHYTITCNLIHQICSPYGKVNRIVIFKKNGVQAMVEFDNVESAKRAKNTLYGCDIYSGCCTLRIEYAKPTRLNVHKNDNDSFDYTTAVNLDGGPQDTNPIAWTSNDQAQLASSNTGISATGGNTNHSNSHQPHANHARGGLGGRNGGRGHHGGGPHHFHPTHHHHSPTNEPHHHVHPTVSLAQVSNQAQHGAAGYNMMASLDQTTETTDAFHQDTGFNVARSGQPPSAYVDPYLSAHSGSSHTGVHGSMYPRQDSHGLQHHMRSNQGSNHGAHFPPNASNALMPDQSNMAHPQGYVIMVYGLHPERLNCDRLFNLFCLYGNVIRVKFLRTKEGCAMVQMGDIIAADRCISSLNKITLFDNEVQISYSKQSLLHEVIQPFILPDGSPSFKDFTANKNNRFKNPELASKNRILPPSQVLHFFNAPIGITEEELINLFKHTSGHEPISVKIFTPKADNMKSYSGLATFKDVIEATESLVVCNHLNMPRPGAPHPYILRLCFSPPTYIRPNPSYPSAST